MVKIIKDIFSHADEKVRLRYLLAKDDLDDIQAALMLIYQQLITAIPDLNITVYPDKIGIYCETKNHITLMIIRITGETLLLQYNGPGQLELFNDKSGSDPDFINRIRGILECLGFFKTGKAETQSASVYLIIEEFGLHRAESNR